MPLVLFAFTPVLCVSNTANLRTRLTPSNCATFFGERMYGRSLVDSTGTAPSSAAPARRWSRLRTVKPPSLPLYDAVKMSGHVPSSRCWNTHASMIPPAVGVVPVVNSTPAATSSSLFVVLSYSAEHRPTVRPELVASDATVCVSADDARAYFEALPNVPGPDTLSRNFLGATFKERGWVCTGRMIHSATKGGHANRIFVWHWEGA